MTPDFTTAETIHYARQMALPGFGHTAQQALRDAHVLVIGAGGLGSPALMHLAAAGVGTLEIYDDDTVDPSNLHRQLIHSYPRIGQRKTDSAATTLTQLNPHITIITHPTRLAHNNAYDAINRADLVIDGTDNFATRYLINDICVTTATPYIWAAISAWDAHISVFALPHTPCYRCLHPTPPPPNTVPTCAQTGVLPTLPGLIGTTQAHEAITLITGIGTPLTGTLATYSGHTNTWNYLPLNPSPTCPTCSTKPTTTPHHQPDPPPPNRPTNHPSALTTATTIDIRPPHTTHTNPWPTTLTIPLPDILANPHATATRLATHPAPRIIYCESGTTAQLAALTLTDAGLTDVSAHPGPPQ